jgi:hypothetical protein
MGQVKHLDRQVNTQGYLRLMTTEPYAVNISNSLENSPEIPEDFLKRVALHFSEEKNCSTKRSKGLRAILSIRFVKKVLMKFYNTIFEWYIKNDEE